MNQVKSEEASITNGNTHDFDLGTSRIHRIEIRSLGAGTASVQPYFGSNSGHQAYSVTNDTLILNLTGVTKLEVTVTGGDADVSVFGYSG